jgi:glycogen phosphorylase
MRRLLPRHLEIILDINSSFLQAVKNACPNDPDISGRVSIIEESQPDMVRMTFIAIVGSHKVNNVSEIQNELVQQTIFKDFITIYGLDKFTLVSNGITPRRWLHQANPRLSKLLSDTTQGYEFLTDLRALSMVESKVDDESFRKDWAAIKRANKVRLAKYIEDTTGITIIPTALFDVQVSRIHEQRRQQLNVFGIIYRYLKLKGMEPDERKEALARVSIFSGKMAPGDQMSKQVVRLIKGIMNIVNNDKDTAELLKVVFIEDYNVSKAEMIIPAADISEHISTAGIM